MLFARARRIVVTGASGFIGRHVIVHLASKGHEVLALSRRPLEAAFTRAGVSAGPMPDLPCTEGAWQALLRPQDVIVHLAGLAHGSVDDPRHDSINHCGTAVLAAAAAKAKIDRLVFISSIAAQSGSSADEPLTEEGKVEPVNAYGRSKLAAEQAVIRSGTRYTILRPVAVYGGQAKGHWALLKRLAALPVPLPLKGLTAPRSILSVQNLARAVELMLSNVQGSNQLFLVADPVPRTVAELIERLRKQQGRGANLFYVPPSILKAALFACGQGHLWSRIGEPLVVSTNYLQSVGWRPHHDLAV